MNHQSISLSKTTALKVQFLIEVELGVPSKKCRNFGICRIHPLGRFKKELPVNSEKQHKCCRCKNSLPCNRQCSCKIEGVVSVLENDRVEICFLRGAIKPSDYKKYFMSGKFLVEEDYVFFDAEIPDSDFRIMKGTYPIVINKTLIKILFMS